MKRISVRTVFLAWLVAGLGLNVAASQLDWLTDTQQALAKARTEQKLVLLNFTGSDWCPWCIRLEKEVFSTPEFAAYAKTNLILVLVDFPRKKQLSEDQKKANSKLAAKYGIEGLPTLVVLDSTGNQLGKLGYEPGGPSRVIAKLEKLRANAQRNSPTQPAPDPKTKSEQPNAH